MSSTIAVRATGLIARILPRITTVRAPYQAAVFRIGLGAVLLAFLLREWPHRHELYGNSSALSFDLAQILVREEGTFTVLMWSDGNLWFETVYLLTIGAALAVLLGWHTRGTSMVLMAGVLSVINRNTLVGDGGDNVVKIMVIYLVLTRCATVWSLDARRRARQRQRTETSPTGETAGLLGPALWAAALLPLAALSAFPTAGWLPVFWTAWAAQGIWYAATRWFPRHEARAVLDAAASMLHNTAMLVIAAQVCLIYATAGWYKIQGSRWQDGTALYYALHLDYFSPWPALSGFVAEQTLLVLALTYGTVIVQVAFPFTLTHRKIKNALLALMILEHLGIAVLLGIPFLSMAMIVCDMVFLPTPFLLALSALGVRLGARLRVFAPEALRAGRIAPAGRQAGRPVPPEPSAVPQPRPADSADEGAGSTAK
ncbi:HTTM domain-containing protein [Streptomyces sp. JH34]|uniref:HTTM domain-containing protein n=1 Tax=Streptomyces sp. JH34 TaxID=2793633 RepID=UPI0023F79653|nr:HTTM domain-containing protein [Streptomyces sp. JH34]MDF6020634.1 HTTM domain-containing protein [Streptomyces sp. JH34]